MSQSQSDDWVALCLSEVLILEYNVSFLFDLYVSLFKIVFLFDNLIL